MQSFLVCWNTFTFSDWKYWCILRIYFKPAPVFWKEFRMNGYDDCWLDTFECRKKLNGRIITVCKSLSFICWLELSYCGGGVMSNCVRSEISSLKWTLFDYRVNPLQLPNITLTIVRLMLWLCYNFVLRGFQLKTLTASNLMNIKICNWLLLFT
jgi:hypothetical protein